MRQDPDIIMVGEIRDHDTANMAIQAALTGHLVLSTLHTNDAPSSLTRLHDLGVQPFLTAATILGVLAQRLVRRLCPHCKVEKQINSQEWEHLTFDYITAKAKRTFFDTEDSVLVPEGTQVFLVNSILGVTLVHNNTNNLFNPSKGFYHTLTVESAGALPKFLTLFNKGLLYSQYVKLGSVNSFYFDISGDRATSIVAAHFEIGDIIEYGSGENIQPVDPLYKYYMGGGNSLRGWRGQTGGILDDPSQGGKFLIEGSLEWRRKPFPVRSFLNPVWGVLFLDYGNVWESGRLFKFNQIALSAGFGIRYDTFVGPVRIDLGFKLFDPMAEEGNKWLWNNPSRIFKDKKYAIQFGLGNAF